MTPTPVFPADKRDLAKRVGKQLSGSYGRKSAYAPYQITAAMRQLNYPLGWDCWALSLYASLYDFNTYHEARGERCDYAAMRTAMLCSIDPPDLTRLPESPASRYTTDDGWSLLDLFDWLDLSNFWD